MSPWIAVVVGMLLWPAGWGIVCSALERMLLGICQGRLMHKGTAGWISALAGVVLVMLARSELTLGFPVELRKIGTIVLQLTENKNVVIGSLLIGFPAAELGVWLGRWIMGTQAAANRFRPSTKDLAGRGSPD